jgi:hypothetical protein
MNLTKALNILRHHQSWRLGEEITMLHPKQLTEAIDTILNQFKYKYMTEEKLKRGNELEKQIQETKENIRIAKITQLMDVVERPMYIEFLGTDGTLKVPESLFRIIGKLILNEHQQKLIELENEFNNL